MAFGKFKRMARQQTQAREMKKIQQTPLPSVGEVQEVEDRVNQLSDAEQNRINQARPTYKEEALKDLSTPVGGLTPQQRQAMQETANKQISGQIQNYSRLLSSKMGQAGVRGGAANSVQAELMDRGLEARNQFLRDLNSQDADIEMQKLAALLSSIEGRTAQDILQRQSYRDYLTGTRDRQKQDAAAQYFNKYFNKV